MIRAMDGAGSYKAWIDLRRETAGRFSREHLWLKRTFGGYIVTNVPFATQRVSYGDVVSLDEAHGRIVGVERASVYRNGAIRWRYVGSESSADVDALYKRLRQSLDAHGIVCERAEAHSASVAVPRNLSDVGFDAVIASLPEIESAHVTPLKGARRRRLRARRRTGRPAGQTADR